MNKNGNALFCIWKQFKDLETEKEMLMASNRSLAEFNLAKQPELEEGKKELKELGEKGSQLCASVDKKLEEISEWKKWKEKRKKKPK